MATNTKNGQLSESPDDTSRRELAFAAHDSRFYNSMKGVIGRTLAAILLVPGLPVMLVLLVIVRLSSRGPAIYRQSRVGRNGQVFVMYKIRTMILDAEAQTGPAWSVEDDPRITKLGKVMRRLHMDELPQLFNVLKGEMVLIGPRPERPEIVDVLAKKIPPYRERLRVAPGITGLAQINLPADTDLESVRKKLRLDLDYIEELNPWLDLRIFFCSLLRIVGIPGDTAMRMMSLEREITALGEFHCEEPGAEVTFASQYKESDGGGQVVENGQRIKEKTTN